MRRRGRRETCSSANCSSPGGAQSRQLTRKTKAFTSPVCPRAYFRSRAWCCPKTCRPSIAILRTRGSPLRYVCFINGFPPIPGRSGGSRNLSACWRTTPRSTPFGATACGRRRERQILPVPLLRTWRRWYAACVMDRNGLRPARYVITRDRHITLASEIGVYDYVPEDVITKGRLKPGQMIAADTQTGELLLLADIDARLKSRHPYRKWLNLHARNIAASLAERLCPASLSTPRHWRALKRCSKSPSRNVIRCCAYLSLIHISEPTR